MLDEQYLYLAEDADDLHTRSVVSDSPLAGQEFRDARRHADATAGRRREVVDSIARLEGRQDELLDRLAR